MHEFVKLISAIDEFAAEATKHFESHPKAGLGASDPRLIRDLRAATDQWTAFRGRTK